MYAATGGGFAAALAAARAGAAVVLVGADGGGGSGAHVGGMVTGGLQHADCGNASVLGGIAREYFVAVESAYPGRSTDPGLQPVTGPPCWMYEAHVGEAVMRAMLAAANVSVVEGQEGVAGVEFDAGDATRVAAVTTVGGGRFVGDVFVDASYEGDLLAGAGATMAMGREGVDVYGEPHARCCATTSCRPTWSRTRQQSGDGRRVGGGVHVPRVHDARAVGARAAAGVAAAALQRVQVRAFPPVLARNATPPPTRARS